jgi:hypothetical protein
MAVGNSSFDLDLSYGQAGENLVEELLTQGRTVEVKRDRKWHSTGNVYVEVECWYMRTESWEPSGVMVTKAEYWAFVLENGVLMVPTNHVLYAIKNFGRQITCEIPPNRSKGYLITVDDLLTAMRDLKDG